MNKITIFLTVVLFATLTLNSNAQNDPFITTWKTDNLNGGSTNSTSIKIPTTGGNYNYDVDWENDGVFDDIGVTGDITHNYGTAGTYQVAIRGDFPRIYFNFGGERSKILSVDQWGDIEWASMADAFVGCDNISIPATDAPDLTQVSDMSSMFFFSSINSPIDHWNVSSVTNMQALFANASSFNQDLNSWDVSSVTDMRLLFAGASVFNGNISSWDVSSVIDMHRMFSASNAFNQDIGSWDISSATNVQAMFINASAFNQDISSWDVSSITNFFGTFFNASSFNQDISSWDVSSVINMSSMFTNAIAFNQDLSSWNTSGTINMTRMFANTALDQDLGSLDVSSALTLLSMLDGTPMSTANYDATLTGWAAQSVQSGVTFGAAGVQFCNAIAARDDLINNHSWTITDAGQAPISCASVPLPVELVSFNAGLQGQEALLTWETASEINFEKFAIERSYTGHSDFKTIEFVFASGGEATGQQYGFSDKVVDDRTRYYRLKIIDQDDSYVYSSIKVVDPRFNQSDKLAIFPNPTSGLVNIKSSTRQFYQIFSTLGKEVRSGWVDQQPNSLQLDDLPSGLYFFKAGDHVQELVVK